MDDFRIETLNEGLYDAVAELFNASDEAWPGGLVHGNPLNRERIARRYSDMEVVEVLVGMSGDKAVGILDIAPFHAERAAAYVNFLNVHPAWHGKGCGRRLLERAVDVATRRGFERLDLYTWAGNMKAVPAYKKTGFFWYPGTSVYMQNFLPQILTAPPLADFFRRNEWYKTFKRPIEVQEDLERRQGRRVYAYRFEGDGKLDVVVDVLSSRMCSVRLNDEGWSIETEGEELFVGYPRRVACRSASSEPALFCKPGFSVGKVSDADASPGISMKNESSFLVHTSAVAPRHREEERAEAVDAVFATATGQLKLGLGFVSRLPVEASFLPSPGILPPGGSGELDMMLCNRTDHEVSQSTVVSQSSRPDGTRIDGVMAPLERRVVRVKVDGNHGTRIDARTEISSGPTYTEPVPFLSPVPLRPDAEAYEDKLFASDGRYVLEVEPNKGARMTLRDVATHNPVAGMIYEEIGPPFRPGQMRAKAYTARTEETPDGLRLTFESEAERPKVKVVRVVDLLKDGTISIARVLRNLTAEDASFQLMHTGYVNQHARRATSTSRGTADFETRQEYPGWQDDIPIAPATNPECWQFTEGLNGRLGTAWSRKGLVQVRTGSQSLPDLVWAVSIPAGGEASVGKFLLLPGAEAPSVVRRAASHLNGPYGNERKTDAPLDIRIDPWPLIAPGQATLTVTSLRESESRGTVRWLSSGKELCSMPLALKGYEASASSTFNFAPEAPGTLRGELVITTESEEVRRPLNAASISGDGVESVEQGDTWTIRNGLLEFRATPSYAAVLHSLRRADTGVEYLSSPHPAVTELAWFRPWRGGISLHACPIDSYPGRLDEERWTARAIRGKLGNCPVFGVRMTATLEKSSKELHGVVVQRDYLTARGSPLLIARTTLAGMGGATVDISDQTFTSFKSPGSFFEGASAGETVRGLRTRSTRWIIMNEPVVLCAGEGHAIAAAHDGGTAVTAYVMDLGLHGVHYEASGLIHVRSEPVAYQYALAACRDADEARRWTTAARLAAQSRFTES